jgi:tetratricopeptide (TPR) repeat protein
MLKAARSSFDESNFGIAEGMYRRLLDSEVPPAQVAFLRLQLGRCLQARKSHAYARLEFERVLADPVDPGAGSLEAFWDYGDVKPAAQAGIGQCFEAENRWQEALDAYIVSRDKYPRRHWCGNCAHSLRQKTLEAIERCTALLSK